MNAVNDAKTRFIEAWGAMGSTWGINKTMARVHALLLASSDPLSSDDVIEQLDISRGNASMSLRSLVDWGLVRRSIKKGDRREFFEAEKDSWKMFCTIARERKKREVEPVLRTLRECKAAAGRSKDGAEFRTLIESLEELVETVDSLMGRLAQKEKGQILRLLLKFIS